MGDSPQDPPERGSIGWGDLEDKSNLSPKTNPDDELYAIRNDDYRWKLCAREKYARAFTALLLAQNIAVGLLLYGIYTKNHLSRDVTAVTGGVAAATGVLVETYYLIRIMVQWIFTDTDYSAHRKPDAPGN